MRTTIVKSAIGALVAAALCAPSFAQPLVARAASVAGRVLLTPATGGPAFALTSGYALGFADRIDTRGGGRVVIDLSDGSVVVVQPETLLTIKDFRAAETLRELFEITVGMVRVKINHFGGKPNPYRMNSPTASIAVRGTEFTVTVSEAGDTSVDVYEGAVEVTSRTDPSSRVLVEGGHGVLVRHGAAPAPYVLQGRGPAPRPVNAAEREHREAPPQPGSPPDAPAKPGFPGTPAVSALPPVPDQHAGGLDGMQAHAVAPSHGPGSGGGPQMMQALPSTYDRYLGTLAAVGYLPFSSRYVAFGDRYSDALDNPAFATRFHVTDGRFVMMPVWNGGQGGASGTNTPAIPTFSLSPQGSLFTPLGTRFVAGGSVTSYRVAGTDSGAANPALADSTSRFLTGSAMLGARLSAADSLGIGLERLSGNGNDGSAGRSTIGQTRLSAGYSRDLSTRHQVSVSYRRGWIDASNDQQAGSVIASGSLNDLGFRLRGALNPRFLYGVSANWSFADLGERLTLMQSSHTDRDLGIRRYGVTFGAGYLVDRKTVLSVDAGFARSRLTSTARAEQGLATDHEVSFHAAVQRNFTRKLFGDASFLGIARSYSGSSTARFPEAFSMRDFLSPFSSTLYPNGGRFSDFGAGWRMSPNFTLQYLYSTDYGVTGGLHAVVFKYTIRASGE